MPGLQITDDAVAEFRGDRTELDSLDAQGKEIHGSFIRHRSTVAGDFDSFGDSISECEVGDRCDPIAAHAGDHAFLPHPSNRWAERQGGEGVGERDASFLLRIFIENIPDSPQDGNNRGDCCRQFEELRDIRRTDFHDPINDLGGQRRVLGDDVTFGAVSALWTGQRIFDAHHACGFKFSGIGLPAHDVALIVTRNGSACGCHGQAIRPLLDQLLDLTADAIQWMPRDIVRVPISQVS